MFIISEENKFLTKFTLVLPKKKKKKDGGVSSVLWELWLCFLCALDNNHRALNVHMHHRYTAKEKRNPRLLGNPVWEQLPGLWEVQDYLSAVPFSHFPQLSALAQNVMTALRDVSQLQKPSALRMLSQNKITQTCSFRKSFHFQIFSLLTNQGCYEGQ